MFVVLRRFSADEAGAARHLSGHQEWIRRGLDDGAFLPAGRIQPGPGGAVLAHGLSKEDLAQRVAADDRLKFPLP